MCESIFDLGIKMCAFGKKEGSWGAPRDHARLAAVGAVAKTIRESGYEGRSYAVKSCAGTAKPQNRAAASADAQGSDAYPQAAESDLSRWPRERPPASSRIFGCGPYQRAGDSIAHSGD